LPGGNSLRSIPSFDSLAAISGGRNHKATYRRRDLASIKVEDDVCCMMGSWVLEESVGDELAAESVATREQAQTPQRHRGLSVSHYS